MEPQPDTPAEAADDRHSVAALQEGLGADFDVKQRLGKGSMATVYLARERALGRLVAVKVLLPRLARDETARRRFEREAKAAASLAHPHVVEVFRFGRLTDETPYLVMRFVKGRTLEERLAAEGPLPVSLACEVLAGVASALAAAHAQGIVHRDVRPANILWDEERKQALLADFGIAALLATSGEDATRLTKTGQMLGDPRYLSPEQLLDHDLTELADMYAFGVLGYELLTGKGPYEARTNAQWITAHLSGTPKDLKQLRPDVDPVAGALLVRCLNREPKHRPSAATVAAALAVGAGAPQAGARAAAGSAEGAGGLGELIRRRVPQIVLATVAGGWALLEVIETIFDNDSLIFRLGLAFVGSAIVAATVVAWFHGERGKQRTQVLEWILLGAIGVVWASISVWIAISV
ncbi:MAG: serine/threonine-protein kinase [Gemmatimonadota bacterium]